MAGIAQRVFVENFEEQLIIDTVSEELNLRIFLDDDEGTIVNVYGGDINVCPDELIVVKNFRLGGVTGSGVIDIGAFAREFMIDQIIFTRTAGVPTTAKAGWTAGTNELSHLVALIPKSVSVKVVPPSTATEVHFTLAAGTFNIDLILIRYKI